MSARQNLEQRRRRRRLAERREIVRAARFDRIFVRETMRILMKHITIPPLSRQYGDVYGVPAYSPLAIGAGQTGESMTVTGWSNR